MIDLSTLLSTPASAPSATPVAVTGGGASAGRFGQTLEAFLDARDAAGDPPAARGLADDGQDPADDGKGLPAAADDDAADLTTVAPPTWFPSLLVPPAAPALGASGSDVPPTAAAPFSAADLAAVVTPDRATGTTAVAAATIASRVIDPAVVGTDSGLGDTSFALPSAGTSAAIPLQDGATSVQSAASQGRAIGKLKGVIPAVSRLASAAVPEVSTASPAAASDTLATATAAAASPATVAPARNSARVVTSDAASATASTDAALAAGPAFPTTASLDTGRVGANTPPAAASTVAPSNASPTVSTAPPIAGQTAALPVAAASGPSDTPLDMAPAAAAHLASPVSVPADAAPVVQANATTANPANDLSTDAATVTDAGALPAPADPALAAMPPVLPVDLAAVDPTTVIASASGITALAQAAGAARPVAAASIATGPRAAAPISGDQQAVGEPATIGAEPLAAATPADGDNTVDMLTRATVSATQTAIAPAPHAPASNDGATLPTQANAAAPAIVVSSTPQPAGQIFAAAIATAWRDRSTRRADQGAISGSTASAALDIAAPIHMADLTQVQATGASAGAGLDLTQDSGLQGIVDRIETLRDGVSDAADARDTRIRLVPDALGSVEIAVRQDGDRVHVHFTAEHDATRALIADAQPRLTELAAARGVRIGDTSVTADAASAQSVSSGSSTTSESNGGSNSAGSSGNDTTPQPRPTHPHSTQRSTPTRVRAQTATESPTETRIA